VDGSVPRVQNLNFWCHHWVRDQSVIGSASNNI
jgi:hypothetical protein